MNRWRARLAQLAATEPEVLDNLANLDRTDEPAAALPKQLLVPVQNVQYVQNPALFAPERPAVPVQNVQIGQNPDEAEERAALVEFGANVPRAWAEGYAALCVMPIPTGFWPDRWNRILDSTGTFLDRWAATAIACGWTDLDVFGADPDAPDRRFDCMGLVLLLDRAEVVGVDEAGADLVVTGTGSRQRFRRRPLPMGTVSLWKLVPRDDR